MQELKAPTLFKRAIGGKARWSVLALSVMLAACQAPNAGAEGQVAPVAAQGAGAPTAAPEAAASAQPAPVQSAAPAPVATTADAGDDQDQAPAALDDSYNKAKLRPEYAKCIKATGGVTPEIQDCQAEEFAWHQKRLRAALAKLDEGPTSEFKDKVDEEQAAYMKDTDKNCTWNPDEDGQGQMLDAESCRINRYANRADAIEAIVSDLSK